MNYNARIQAERINGNFTAEVEVSGTGRNSRKHIVAETFDDLMAQIKDAHDSGVRQLEEYHGIGPMSDAPKQETQIDMEDFLLDPKNHAEGCAYMVDVEPGTEREPCTCGLKVPERTKLPDANKPRSTRGKPAK